MDIFADIILVYFTILEAFRPLVDGAQTLNLIDSFLSAFFNFTLFG